VSSAGDVDADGYDDVVVGGQSDLGGRVLLYRGSSTGLMERAAWTAEAEQADDDFALYSLSSAGDVNDDGYDDVVVGAPNFDGGLTDEGRAYLYLGSSSGPDTVAVWTAESDQAGALFGRAVSDAEDVNGDGYDDVVVGASDFTGDTEEEGRTYVFHGSAAGLEATAAWMAESGDEWAAFGLSVSSAGDVNGDGYGDVVIGAEDYDDPTISSFDEGKAYLYLGSGAGLESRPAWLVEGNAQWFNLGSSVSSAGDVNGDGFGDVIVGSAGAFAESASVYLGH
jgi:hypothetical protein